MDSKKIHWLQLIATTIAGLALLLALAIVLGTALLTLTYGV